MYRLFYPEEMRAEEARRNEELRLLATEWQNRAERKGGSSNPKEHQQPNPKLLPNPPNPNPNPNSLTLTRTLIQSYA
jgi:hypothetical protein